MLVLARKPNESIIINGPCVLTVVSISPGQVRLGIQADRSTVIARRELLRGPRDALLSVWERLTGRFGSEPIEVGAPAETPDA